MARNERPGVHPIVFLSLAKSHHDSENLTSRNWRLYRQTSVWFWWRHRSIMFPHTVSDKVSISVINHTQNIVLGIVDGLELPKRYNIHEQNWPLWYIVLVRANLSKLASFILFVISTLCMVKNKVITWNSTWNDELVLMHILFDLWFKCVQVCILLRVPMQQTTRVTNADRQRCIERPSLIRAAATRRL